MIYLFPMLTTHFGYCPQCLVTKIAFRQLLKLVEIILIRSAICDKTDT